MRGKPVDNSGINRILIRFTNWIGDSVMALPALEAAREVFPKSELTVLAKSWVMPLFRDHPAVDHLLPIRKKGNPTADLLEILRVARIIRRHKFDMAILFQNAFEAALLSFLGGVRIRIGYDTDGRGLLLTHGVKRNRATPGGHQVEYYLDLLRAMNWEAKTREPRLHVSPGDRDAVGALLASKGTGPEDFILGLSPGAAYGPAKRWPVERFAAVGDLAVERWGSKVLIVGSDGEREICGRLHAAMRHPSLNLCGMTSLGEAMALIESCRLFVTNDSGLMHVASALDVPTVAVFGSTDPEATGPRGSRARVVRRETPCAPCLRPVCPSDYRCMMGIEPEEVWGEMEDLRKALK